MVEIAKLLSNKLFENLSLNDLKEILKDVNLSERNYKKNESIFYENYSKVKKIGFLIKGALGACTINKKGDVINKSIFFAKDIFPEYLVINNISLFKYDLVCLEPSSIIWMDANDFLNIVKHNQKINLALIKYMSQRGYKDQIRISCLNLKTIREKISFYILKMNSWNDDKVPIPVNQKVFADILNVKRSSLNKELNLMSNEDLISYDRNNIYILNKKRLEKIVNE